jgi:hypothetical protein
MLAAGGDSRKWTAFVWIDVSFVVTPRIHFFFRNGLQARFLQGYLLSQ